MQHVTREQAIEFYNKGYIVLPFKKTPTLERFQSLLRELRDGKLRKDGYGWEVNKSYREQCKDFRPDIYTYDPVLLELFKDQHLHEIIGEITGLRDHCMAFIKLRWNLPGKAYTFWHRDTNYYKGKIKGATPSLIGLNYYPSLGDESEHVLSMWPGSHHASPKYQFIDWFKVKFWPAEKVFTSDDHYVLFDTAVVHDLMPPKSPNGCLRIITQYVREFQLDMHGWREDLHEMYKEKVMGR